MITPESVAHGAARLIDESNVEAELKCRIPGQVEMSHRGEGGWCGADLSTGVVLETDGSLQRIDVAANLGNIDLWRVWLQGHAAAPHPADTEPVSCAPGGCAVPDSKGAL